MPITDAPSINELPTSERLLRSTMIALATALLLLVVAVLPAEYGVDVTGAGRMLGLTEMGELKVALAKEAAAADAAESAAGTAGQVPVFAATGTPIPERAPAVAVSAETLWTHITEVVLAPNEGKEVKLVMAKGARAQFDWSVAGGVVNHDTHGDSTGAPNSYHNYLKGTGVSGDQGELMAAFDGAHGWFWRNRGREAVTVTLRTKGAYTELKKMY